jgi:hypothetical protein
LADYARDSASLDAKRIEAMLRAVEDGIAGRTYLAITPQFVVAAMH